MTVVIGRASPGDVLTFAVDEADPGAAVPTAMGYGTVLLEDGKLSPLTRQLAPDPARGVYHGPLLNLGTACR